uniref:Cytochrome c oxidase subunit 2 n=1 Tax=Rhynchocinetes durbanensis TaxID=516932 RepID=A0A109PTL3_9EUCA|nr:cytochrome c oxidase subunit 2 [Rhynchocinetes durbanensis]AMA20509.1 cytochrome c oxidase subunit 2 [Rhynchocinetes durbanensis]
MSSHSTLTFQDSASPIMEQLILFHDHIMLVLVLITTLVGFVMATLFFNESTDRFLLENQKIEIIWTVLPAIILIFIALPSLRILYLLDEVGEPEFSIKAIGRQWYWNYEYSEFENLNFDSYMVQENDLSPLEPRLLNTDNHIIVPVNTQFRILTTSSDVIHSWTIPSLGVKADAVPGRLNQTSFSVNRVGLFFGQCSEICGANHSFMPITLESVPSNDFTTWVSTQI